MTLGNLLASKRKLANLTQQQVGEALSVSPQAVSKWENDLAQPDLSSLKRLAELYNVSVAQLIDAADESGTTEPAPPVTPAPQPAPQPAPEPAPEVVVRTVLGVCEECNTAIYEAKGLHRVNEARGGKTVLCSRCFAKRNRQKAEAELGIALKERRRAIGWGITVAVLVALISVLVFKGLGPGPAIGLTVLFTACSFCLMGCLMFEDNWVCEMWVDMVSYSFRAPGIIFSFDIEGCAFLIAMKILFWAIGAALSIGAFALATALGFLFAPFVIFTAFARNKDEIYRCEHVIRENSHDQTV